MPDVPARIADFFSDLTTEELARFDPAAVPRHVAIIMDGNGRWARARRLPRVAGHRAGAKAVREVIEAAIKLGIRYLTIYSFSSENWRRSEEEVSSLMGLFVEVLDRELQNLEAEGVRLRLIGRRDRLAADVLLTFEQAEARTAESATLDLLVALDYGGRGEITAAARSIARDVLANQLDVDDIDEDALEARLYTAGVPDPDLLIRTSGELRVSNFLLWQIAYSEIWVTDTYWPDFSRYDLLSALIDFQNRQRRFGA